MAAKKKTSSKNSGREPEAEAPVATETETEIELPVEEAETPPVEQPEETPVETPEAEKPKLIDPEQFYADEKAHILPDADRVQVIVRLPVMDALVQRRNPKFKAFGTMFGPKDTNGHVHPDYRGCVLWGAVDRKACHMDHSKETIAKGLAKVCTAGHPTGSGQNRITLGGGLSMTNDCLAILFGMDEETVQDFAEQGVPYDQLVADLRAKKERGEDDRQRREANASRKTSGKARRQQGRRPEVEYAEEEAEEGASNWGL